MHQKHIIEKVSGFKMAPLANCHETTILRWLKRLGIPRNHGYKHTKETREKLRKYWTGKWPGSKNPNWKGGRFIASNGYVKIYCPNHPCADSKGYAQEHSLIAYKVMGRKLNHPECVHHINGIKTDNRNCNLLICTQGYHCWLEGKMADLYKKEHFIK